MNKDKISNSIVKFAKNFKNEEFGGISTEASIYIRKVDDSGRVIFERDGDEDKIFSGQIGDYADAFARYETVHYTDAFGDSYSNQVTVEGLVACHPQVVVCYQSQRDGSGDSKHTRWLDYVVHKPGRIVRRDDFRKRDISQQPKTSDWTAPEWCLAVEAARHLLENPSDEDELYHLLKQSTDRCDWVQKVRLLKSIISQNDPDVLVSDEERELAHWYCDFSNGDYGDWEGYFAGTSPEEGLSEHAVSTGPEGEDLCEILGLDSPASKSAELAGVETIGMFVGALRDTEMHVSEEKDQK
jgi:hypothetical protein